MTSQAPSLLLALPDPCILVVLQCLAADDLSSLFSVARTHSRLHQAAVLALHSMTMELTQQQQMDGVLQYLSKHGDHVESIDVSGGDDGAVTLRELPPTLQLSSLQTSSLGVLLGPRDGFQGVLGAAAVVAALKQLRLRKILLLDGRKRLAAALSLLPAGLQHLSIVGVKTDSRSLQFPTSVLHQLPQLTYLELAGVWLQGADKPTPSLQPLQALTRLVDLRLCMDDFTYNVTVSMLSGTCTLTRLEVASCSIEPGIFAGKVKLQHLQLKACALAVGPLLSGLQDLQQLTHLTLRRVMQNPVDPPATAYTALTASSKLQHLDISMSGLPAGVWQHIFPASRQLPHLQYLDLGWVNLPGDSLATPPEGSRLVSCCPGLQSLDMQHLRYSAELLAPLQGLSGLHTLTLAAHDLCGDAAEGFEEVCPQVVAQLTRLRDLRLYCPGWFTMEVLMHLTQLQHLTRLDFVGVMDRCYERIQLSAEGPDDEPVWRKILRLHLDHNDVALAQQAAAALAE